MNRSPHSLHQQTTQKTVLSTTPTSSIYPTKETEIGHLSPFPSIFPSKVIYFCTIPRAIISDF